MNSRQKVLLIDDEQSVCDVVSDYFDKAGYEVVIARSGAEGIEKSQSARPDIIILDLMLPDMDGLDICRDLRKTSSVPIIMLSARTEEVDRVLGLEMGADDYVVKPFSPRELLARVKAVLRRSAYVPNPERQQSVSLPGVVISRASREVVIGDNKIDLTPKEFDLLWYMAANHNHVFTREQLLEHVWAYQEFYGDERTVDQHIKRLRRKIEFPGSPCRITTIWGVGYKFEANEHGGY